MSDKSAIWAYISSLVTRKDDLDNCCRQAKVLSVLIDQLEQPIHFFFCCEDNTVDLVALLIDCGNTQPDSASPCEN
jgi:hypothetical protein